MALNDANSTHVSQLQSKTPPEHYLTMVGTGKELESCNSDNRVVQGAHSTSPEAL